MHHCLEKVPGHPVCSGNLVEEESRTGRSGGHTSPCKVVREQDSTGPVTDDKLKPHE